jgi:triacylglycerol esterase/lipase EstA (alpha/beta hydrolase family)
MFPIILAHGIARFDILRQKLARKLNIPPNPLDDRLQYFKLVRTHLNRNGFPSVTNTDVEFAGSVDVRAHGLKSAVEEILRETGAAKVNIIAHSMGGLDARRMIVDLGMADKVASLTTIGTPHHGSMVADEIIKNRDKLWIRTLKEAVDFDTGGVEDLTQARCADFNRRAEESEAKNDVFYQTYSSSDSGLAMFSALLWTWLFINNEQGDNDGLVPVTSQKWTDRLTAADGTTKPVANREFPFRADHLNQCGWWNLSEAVGGALAGSFTRREDYEEQVRNVYLDIARNLPD